MNNKKLPRKTTSAIFLAIVLVTGTITLLFSSSMTNAQTQPYSGYNSYGPEYLDSNNYNSYEPDYGMENKYGKPYGNDNNYYESQYRSYKSDYKPQYPSYDKDNYKSQKR